MYTVGKKELINLEGNVYFRAFLPWYSSHMLIQIDDLYLYLKKKKSISINVDIEYIYNYDL